MTLGIRYCLEYTVHDDYTRDRECVEIAETAEEAVDQLVARESTLDLRYAIRATPLDDDLSGVYAVDLSTDTRKVRELDDDDGDLFIR